MKMMRMTKLASVVSSMLMMVMLLKMVMKAVNVLMMVRMRKMINTFKILLRLLGWMFCVETIKSYIECTSAGSQDSSRRLGCKPHHRNTHGSMSYHVQHSRALWVLNTGLKDIKSKYAQL